ncbi:hypothetical protein AOLI_G00262670, partial [Acnodon oligacanthus]
MGCSSSSTQTVAQENRPGTKPEETSGDTDFVASNGIVAKDAETIADQMHLPVQSALPEELGPGLGVREAPSTCEALQNVELVPEPTTESDLIQTTEGPESTALEKPKALIEPPVLQKESSPAEMVMAQEATVTSAAVEETCPAEDAALVSEENVNADTLSLVESPPAEEPVVSPAPVAAVAPVEAASEISGAAQVSEAEQAPEEMTAEPTNIPTPAVEPSPAPEPEPASEPTPVAELATATEPAPVAEATSVPELTSVVEPTAAPEPTPAVEAAPAAEPVLVQSTPAPEPTPKENPVAAEADPTAEEEPEEAALQSQTQPDAPQPSGPEPIHVEAAAAAAAAAVVLQAAQESAALAAPSTEANTPVQPTMQAPEAPE